MGLRSERVVGVAVCCGGAGGWCGVLIVTSDGFGEIENSFVSWEVRDRCCVACT
jgi:hypothetical protein